MAMPIPEPFDTALIQWNEGTIAELDKSTLLSQEDMTRLNACAPVICHAFNHVQIYRTQTEMIVSVLNDVKFPTPDAKFWQSVREMNVFVENLIQLGFTYREKVLDLEELEYTLSKLPETIDESYARIARERTIINIKKMKFEIQCIQRDAHHRIREIDEWRKIQEQLIPQLACGTDEPDPHQKISYAIRFLYEYKIADENRSRTEGVEAIRNLHSLVVTIMRVINEEGLLGNLIKLLEQDQDLLHFLQRKGIIKRDERHGKRHQS